MDLMDLGHAFEVEVESESGGKQARLFEASGYLK